MLNWLAESWKRACEGEMVLVLDVHRAQKTESVLDRLTELNTTPVYVPGGTTGLVQPLDVVVNAPFKAIVKKLADEHIRNNLENYVQGTVPAKETRVLFTRWVGEAWEQVSREKDMIIRSFKKCGISVPIDGSGDGEINIKELENYEVGPVPDSDLEESDEEDPFAESD